MTLVTVLTGSWSGTCLLPTTSWTSTHCVSVWDNWVFQIGMCDKGGGQIYTLGSIPHALAERLVLLIVVSILMSCSCVDTTDLLQSDVFPQIVLCSNLFFFPGCHCT